MFNNGLCYGLPTIVIATLGGIANEHNTNEFLSMTPIQATWMSDCEIVSNNFTTCQSSNQISVYWAGFGFFSAGCIPFIAKPFGCLITPIIAGKLKMKNRICAKIKRNKSCLPFDHLGRKRAMIIVNIPYAIGWFLLCRATTIWEIFVGSAMHGFAIGLVGSPVYAYVGEIWLVTSFWLFFMDKNECLIRCMTFHFFAIIFKIYKQPAINQRCFERIHVYMSIIWNVHNKCAKYLYAMANGCSILFNSASDQCDCHLFCKFSNAWIQITNLFHMFDVHFQITETPQWLFSFYQKIE